MTPNRRFERVEGHSPALPAGPSPTRAPSEIAATIDLAVGRTTAAIADLGRVLYGRGWVPATSGNLSVRMSGQSCAITVSGRDKGRLTEQDIMLVDLTGAPLGPGRPSAEALLHTSLYTWSADIGAVLRDRDRDRNRKSNRTGG